MIQKEDVKVGSKFVMNIPPFIPAEIRGPTGWFDKLRGLNGHTVTVKGGEYYKLLPGTSRSLITMLHDGPHVLIDEINSYVPLVWLDKVQSPRVWKEGDLARAAIPSDPIAGLFTAGPSKASCWAENVSLINGKVVCLGKISSVWNEPVSEVFAGDRDYFVPLRWLSPVTDEDWRVGDRARVVGIPSHHCVVEIMRQHTPTVWVKTANGDQVSFMMKHLGHAAYNAVLADLGGVSVAVVAETAERERARLTLAVIAETAERERVRLPLEQAEQIAASRISTRSWPHQDLLVTKLQKDLEEVVVQRDEVKRQRDVYKDELTVMTKRAESSATLRLDNQRLKEFLARETPHALTRDGNAIDEALAWLGQLLLEKHGRERGVQVATCPSKVRVLGARLWGYFESLVLIAVALGLLVTFAVVRAGQSVRGRFSTSWEATRHRGLTLLCLFIFLSSMIVVTEIWALPFVDEARFLSIQVPPAPSPGDPKEQAWALYQRSKRSGRQWR
jgi:hypothetical protein